MQPRHPYACGTIPSWATIAASPPAVAWGDEGTPKTRHIIVGVCSRLIPAQRDRGFGKGRRLESKAIMTVAEEEAARLAGALHPDQIILFGSHVWGTPHESSDLDLFVIVSASDLPPHKRAQVAYRSLAGLALPCDVLVVTRAEVEEAKKVKTSLTRRVLEEGRVLYG